MSVISSASGLSALQQRLRFAASNCPNPLVFAENVPQLERRDHAPIVDWDEVGKYGDSVGQAALLGALGQREGKKYGWRPPQDRMMLTHGASGGLSLVLGWLRRRHTAFIGHAPMLRSIAELAEACGYAMAFEPELERLIERLSAREVAPSVVYLCSPANPSGVTISAEQWRTLAALAMRGGHTLLVDQVYDDFVYAGVAESITGQDCDPDRFFCCNSFSKNFAAPGLRIGWMIGSKPAIQALTGLWERRGICLAGPSQSLALALLEGDNQGLVADADDRRRQVRAWLAERSIPLAPCDAGLQTLLPITRGRAEWFADHLLTEHALVVTTSSNYAGVDQEFIRLPFGYSEPVTTRALEILALELRRCNLDGAFGR